MCLNEKTIGDDRPKSAQGSDETELPEFFSKIEIKFNAAKIFLSMLRKNGPFHGQFDCAEGEEG
jgi:hypothetical protein